MSSIARSEKEVYFTKAPEIGAFSYRLLALLISRIYTSPSSFLLRIKSPTIAVINEAATASPNTTPNAATYRFPNALVIIINMNANTINNVSLRLFLTLYPPF